MKPRPASLSIWVFEIPMAVTGRRRPRSCSDSEGRPPMSGCRNVKGWKASSRWRHADLDRRPLPDHQTGISVHGDPLRKGRERDVQDDPEMPGRRLATAWIPGDGR